MARRRFGEEADTAIKIQHLYHNEMRPTRMKRKSGKRYY
jgi:hypothetical protein